MQYPYDEDKFAELVLHVAQWLRGDRVGGATKLHKVLYFADFAHVRRHGRPISGAEYRKLPHGPSPLRLRPVREHLIAEGSAEIVQDDFLGYPYPRLVPLRDAELSRFDEDELLTVKKVIADLDGLTDAQLSDLSRREPGWQWASERETIPYHVAFVVNTHVKTPTSRRLEAEVAKQYAMPPGQ